jgi:hypothetical protein
MSLKERREVIQIRTMHGLDKRGRLTEEWLGVLNMVRSRVVIHNVEQGIPASIENASEIGRMQDVYIYVIHCRIKELTLLESK